MWAPPSCEILPQTKGPFTLTVNVFLYVFENGNKNQRMGSLPILSLNVKIYIDRMLKFNASVDVDGKCERTLTKVISKEKCQMRK